jgi:hypothetical protein
VETAELNVKALKVKQKMKTNFSKLVLAAEFVANINLKI